MAHTRKGNFTLELPHGEGPVRSAVPLVCVYPVSVTKIHVHNCIVWFRFRVSRLAASVPRFTSTTAV